MVNGFLQKIHPVARLARPALAKQPALGVLPRAFASAADAIQGIG
jgi:hypothetical protein